MVANQEKPKLIFFRETPKDLQIRPPLASSLQHLETSFLLIAMGRYPHALIACASSIESCIKAALNKTSDDRLEFKKLYVQAMKVGRDHISSMVNTLVLVYTGASLPLLLLFSDSSRSFLEIINYEIVAEEVIRTLVGSIGLVLAVPITTAIAVFAFAGKGEN